jgi:hypothetical protein
MQKLNSKFVKWANDYIKLEPFSLWLNLVNAAGIDS